MNVGGVSPIFEPRPPPGPSPRARPPAVSVPPSLSPANLDTTKLLSAPLGESLLDLTEIASKTMLPTATEELREPAPSSVPQQDPSGVPQENLISVLPPNPSDVPQPGPSILKGSTQYHLQNLAALGSIIGKSLFAVGVAACSPLIILMLPISTALALATAGKKHPIDKEGESWAKMDSWAKMKSSFYANTLKGDLDAIKYGVRNFGGSAAERRAAGKLFAAIGNVFTSRPLIPGRMPLFSDKTEAYRNATQLLSAIETTQASDPEIIRADIANLEVLKSLFLESYQEAKGDSRSYYLNLMNRCEQQIFKLEGTL